VEVVTVKKLRPNIWKLGLNVPFSSCLEHFISLPILLILKLNKFAGVRVHHRLYLGYTVKSWHKPILKGKKHEEMDIINDIRLHTKESTELNLHCQEDKLYRCNILGRCRMCCGQSQIYPIA
jgi:hypothetical protein